MERQRFEALSRICLNNWHYIRHKTLSFHEEINFFTGHSGSGKSTVIDAMQIVLYANTDGRGFFNKAAADDSDRSLIEYLRGMVNIGEDNRFSYLRNQNFSSTIVLELQRTDTGECQCVGVVFDVETAGNEISRMFFWHQGPLPGHEYRREDRVMCIQEVKRWLLENFPKEGYYFGSHNERFRRQLYDIYLGGLDGEKFPLLFKRAIPFRMNIRLEDFVKEYICMEQNIHIEDMQQSVMEYGRMQRKIEETCREIEKLKEICLQYELVKEQKRIQEDCRYREERLDILQSRLAVSECQERIQVLGENADRAAADKARLQEELEEMTARREELFRRISLSGYEQLKEQLAALNELTEHLGSSRGRWEQTTARLKAWEEEDCVSNRTLWDIEAFDRGEITEEGLSRLKKELKELNQEGAKQQQRVQGELREIRKKLERLREEYSQLKAGNKAYPKDLEQARTLLQNSLCRETGKSVQVDILADLLDIRSEEWRNAVEGYLGYNKLALLVEPRYAALALKIYEGMDRERFSRVSVLDTERVLGDVHPREPGSLAEEVEAKKDYAQAYVDFLLGRVIKCEDREELRRHRIGITKGCVSYRSYRIQHISPALYTTAAYIGKSSIRQRLKLLQQSMEDLERAAEPKQEQVREAVRIQGLEILGQEPEVYLEWKEDMALYQEKQKEQSRLKARLEELSLGKVKEWEAEQETLTKSCEQHREQLLQRQRAADELDREKQRERDNLIRLSESLVQKERQLAARPELEKELALLLKEKPASRYESLRQEYREKQERAEGRHRQEMNRLVELRSAYLRMYQNRNFSPTREDNREYQELLDHLNDERLEEFRARAAEQARTAVEHFKDDFMYKIRSAIKEALQQKDELNRIISRLDFGKDKYQFCIDKSKGPEGRYYDMFMDEALDINPSELNMGLDNQLNLFTMEHENHYAAMINDLIRIFIPPENATPQELEEARRNMDKYADYRTYLSFDMQQLIRNGDEVIRIRLSRMLKKNSGGEGQNPLYVALLASFAQMYRIDRNQRELGNPTIRLVVLDEAFSKMDAEKVASCIQLIRGLGFQALISATNDKMQNYLETVDKIFVFANPNKKAISVQEFERKDFGYLQERMEEG